MFEGEGVLEGRGEGGRKGWVRSKLISYVRQIVYILM